MLLAFNTPEVKNQTEFIFEIVSCLPLPIHFLA